MYSLERGGTNLAGEPVCFRSAAEVQTAVSSLTESSQSLRLVGFHTTEFGNGVVGRIGLEGGTGVGALGAALGGRGLAIVDEARIGSGGSFRARGGQTLTSSQNDKLGRSTNGTDSMSYRTFTGVIFTVFCLCSRRDLR